MATDEHELDDILEAGHRAEQQAQQEGWDELPEAMEMMYDISRLPNPPADFEPSLADWRRYLEVVRPIVEGEYRAWLNERKVRARGLGPTKLPDLEQAVPFAVYIEKRQVARVLAWQKEREASSPAAPGGSLKSTPEMQAVLDEIASWPEMQRQVDPSLWETSTAVLEDTRKSFLGVRQKEPLFDFYVDTLLPLVGRKAPSVWLVLTFLLRRAPEDLGSFRISHLGIAKGTGLTPRSVQDALKHLKAWGLVLVVEEQTWKGHSMAGSSPAMYALVPLAKLRIPGNRFLA